MLRFFKTASSDSFVHLHNISMQIRAIPATMDLETALELTFGLIETLLVSIGLWLAWTRSAPSERQALDINRIWLMAWQIHQSA